jgi:hypothetical protein
MSEQEKNMVENIERLKDLNKLKLTIENLINDFEFRHNSKIEHINLENNRIELNYVLIK